MKKILFITGTRADFGKLKTLMLKMEESPDFECQIFATGMHTLSRYGSTLDEIRKCGFQNIFAHMNQSPNMGAEMDLVLSNTIEGVGMFVREYKPDMIVVHGDRIEALAGATVGVLNNILVAHIEGGEISGTVDELLRHAISKLSHLHFVANEEARTRLLQMGETAKSIFVIGSPDIDIMLSKDLPSIDEAKKRYDIFFEEYFIFVYHPVTTDLHNLMKNIDKTVEAIVASEENFIVIYPNNDRGSDIILETLNTLNDHSRFRLFSSLRFEYFLTLLRNARGVVGNSSAGIREAPVYGVPTINIGKRQLNRYDYPSIINVEEDKEQILDAFKRLPTKVEPSMHFGRGNSAELFIKSLDHVERWQTSVQKQFQKLI